MRHNFLLLYFLGSILFLAFATCVFGAATKSSEGDEELESLLDEFLKETNELNSKNRLKTPEGENLIPLNVQSTSTVFKTSKCNCTNLFMCDVDEKVEKPASLESGSDEDEEGVNVGLVDIRLNTPNKPCPHYLDICCDKLKEGTPVQPFKSKTKQQNCGKRNIGGVGFRIVDGNDNESQFGEFPWMAAITELLPTRYPDDKPAKVFVCGASLIHPRAILTAAHCLQNKSMTNLNVRLGEWDTQTKNELYPHQDVNIERIIMHEKYNPMNVKYDIAIAIIENDAELGPNISPICLPPQGINLDGVKCVASGWGKNEFGKEGLYAAILKKVDLPIVPREPCQNSLKEAEPLLGSKFKLHRSFICAGGESGKDTCKGDGGSPLACQIPGTDTYVQYGIVSWGLKCGISGVPGVYANVPEFTDWITSKLSAAGLDSQYIVK